MRRRTGQGRMVRLPHWICDCGCETAPPAKAGGQLCLLHHNKGWRLLILSDMAAATLLKYASSLLVWDAFF